MRASSQTPTRPGDGRCLSDSFPSAIFWKSAPSNPSTIPRGM